MGSPIMPPNVPAAACERACGRLNYLPRRKPKRAAKVQITDFSPLAGRKLAAVLF